VDDEPDFRNLLCEVLSSMGYSVEGVESAEVAIEKAKILHYAIILTNFHLGGKSGPELITNILEIDPRTFCIIMTDILTDRATTESCIQLLKLGAYDFIQKPFKVAELDTYLVRALKHYEALRKNEEYQTRLDRMVENQVQEIIRLIMNAEWMFDGIDCHEIVDDKTGIPLLGDTVDGNREKGKAIRLSIHIKNNAKMYLSSLTRDNFTSNRILFVYDEPEFRTLMVEALNSMGYSAEGAENPETAIQIAKGKHYAIIFTGSDYPGELSGLDLIHAVQEISPKTFCILIPWIMPTEFGIAAIKRGAYDFIPVPFKLVEFDACLVRAMNHYNVLRQNEAYQNILEKMIKKSTQSSLESHAIKNTAKPGTANIGIPGKHVILMPGEIRALFRQNPGISQEGGFQEFWKGKKEDDFQSFLVSLQNRINSITGEIELSAQDLERIPQFAFDSGNHDWENHLMDIFDRALGTTLGR